jgi:hypothetical protein
VTGVELDELADELRADNAARAEQGDHSCAFDSDTDPTIEPGYGCGGCGCHLSAPCSHCLAHLPADDAGQYAHELRITGRWTR